MSRPAEVENVYANTEQWYPGIRERSKPGTAPNEEVYERVPHLSGKLVSSKPANAPYLRSASQRAAHAEALRLDQERRDRRSDRPSTSPSSPPHTSRSSFRSIFRTLLILLIFLPLFSSFTTNTYTFNLAPLFLPPLRHYWRHSPVNPYRVELREFTPLQLSVFDGDPSRPVYLGIDGEVWDVSANRRVYGKGGSYNMMAGRDAARSFVTGCFQTHLTHDLRGLSGDELRSLDHWKKFFANHEKYTLVGKVLNPPIDPDSPIPPPCRPAGEGEHVGPPEPAPGAVAENIGKHRPGPVRVIERESAGRNEL